MINDQRTLSLIAKGDQKQFRQLMESISGDLLLFAMGFVKNKEIAEEIVSDVFVKIWKKRVALEQINNLKSYLYIAVKNGCLSQIRSNKDSKVLSLDNIPDYKFIQVSQSDDEFIDKNILKQIYNAIDELPPKCKMAFSLAKINGLRYKEIAEIMNISEKTVNNHIVNAVHKICEKVGVDKKTTSKAGPQIRMILLLTI